MPPDDGPPDDDDHVRLRVPADPRYARVVRVATSAFAVRRGLRPVAVEDLRLAVDEALVLLLGAQVGDPDRARRPSRADAAVAADVVVELRDTDGGQALLVELALQPPGGDGCGPVWAADALARFHELIPVDVGVEVVDPAAGRVVLRRSA